MEQKVQHRCSNCGKPAKINVSKQDPHYTWLCSTCYREWLAERESHYDNYEY